MRLAFLLLVLVLCGAQNYIPVETTEVGNTETLTDELQADGWVMLFDGKSLNGWKIYKDRPNNTWEVSNGYLHCKPVDEKAQGSGDKRSDLMSIAEFSDFELMFDWNIAAGGNSGVMFRVTEEYEQPYFSGPEFQLIDDTGYPGKLKDSQTTGANYDVHAPAPKKLNPAGSWNSGKIVVKGNHVEHWVNGQKVVEYDLGSPDWTKRVAASKWKDTPGYAKAPKGHIDFQDHGSEIWFRHIMIRELR